LCRRKWRRRPGNPPRISTVAGPRENAAVSAVSEASVRLPGLQEKAGDTRHLRRASTDLTRSATRAFLVVLGCAACGWGAYCLPVFWRQSALERVAGRIIAQEAFKPEVLSALMPDVEAAEQAEQCRPSALRAAAIVRIRVAEEALSDVDLPSVDSQLSALSDSIRRSLACSPADPFLWAALYWVESSRNGFRPEYLGYLRLSYRLGPNEGWIALKRNRLAFAIFGQLPPDLAETVLEEFASLLNSGFADETVDILTGPGWPVRNLILPRLARVTEDQRQAFARTAYRRGYDIKVPGIQPRDPRPWD
jgi:hypothetical protein